MMTEAKQGGGGVDGRLAWIRRVVVTCVAMTFALMVLGAWVKANGAGLACPDWPACYGAYFPPFPSLENGGTHQGTPVTFTQAQVVYEWLHRAVVGLILVPVAALALLATRDRRLTPELRLLPGVAVGIYLMQALLGALTVITGNPPWATTLHLATAVLWFFTFTVTACYAYLKPFRVTVLPPTYASKQPAEPRRLHFVYQDPNPDEGTYE